MDDYQIAKNMLKDCEEMNLNTLKGLRDQTTVMQGSIEKTQKI